MRRLRIWPELLEMKFLMVHQIKIWANGFRNFGMFQNSIVVRFGKIWADFLLLANELQPNHISHCPKNSDRQKWIDAFKLKKLAVKSAASDGLRNEPLVNKKIRTDNLHHRMNKLPVDKRVDAVDRRRIEKVVKDVVGHHEQRIPETIG
jgi:hypothetical protein